MLRTGIQEDNLPKGPHRPNCCSLLVAADIRFDLKAEVKGSPFIKGPH
jgi:hypothetical protein